MVEIFILIFVVGLLVIYVSGRYYLRESMTVQDAPPVYDTTAVRKDLTPDRPFTSEPIRSLGGYEGDTFETDAVFLNEGDRAASRAEINAAMSGYPLDWSNLPPGSARFQKYREAFVDASQKAAPPNTKEFDSIQGVSMVPPDQDAIDAEELKILAMYRPEKAQDLINYSLDDAETLVKKLYDRRGLIATVEPSKQGRNVFEIVEVKKKDEPIVWEDEVPAPKRYELRGEEQITVPTYVNDLASGLDPYFEPRTSVRMNKNDYTQWTPGLERQFAPTYPVKSWF
jgi:hypothetical protein